MCAFECRYLNSTQKLYGKFKKARIGSQKAT